MGFASASVRRVRLSVAHGFCLRIGRRVRLSVAHASRMALPPHWPTGPPQRWRTGFAFAPADGIASASRTGFAFASADGSASASRMGFAFAPADGIASAWRTGFAFTSANGFAESTGFAFTSAHVGRRDRLSVAHGFCLRIAERIVEAQSEGNPVAIV
jgi:hypothetical protein